MPLVYLDRTVLVLEKVTDASHVFVKKVLKRYCVHDFALCTFLDPIPL